MKEVYKIREQKNSTFKDILEVNCWEATETIIKDAGNTSSVEVWGVKKICCSKLQIATQKVEPPLKLVQFSGAVIIETISSENLVLGH